MKVKIRMSFSFETDIRPDQDPHDIVRDYAEMSGLDEPALELVEYSGEGLKSKITIWSDEDGSNVF